MKTTEQKIRECAKELCKYVYKEIQDGRKLIYEVEAQEILTRHFGQQEQNKIHCPHCGDVLLWSEDRGAHCDGCDDFNPETDLPKEQPDKSLEEIVEKCAFNIASGCIYTYSPTIPNYIRQACIEAMKLNKEI